MRNYFILIVSILVFITGSVIGWKRGTELRQHSIAQAGLLKEYVDHRSQLLPLVNVKDYHTAFEYIEKFVGNGRLTIALLSFLGRSIYEQDGLNGLLTCFTDVTHEAAFGCVHGFFSSAVSQGPESYGPMYQACMKLPKEHQIVCIRHIGYALTAKGDYSIKSINTAFKECEHFPYFRSATMSRFAGCQKGVLGEYFMTRIGKYGTGIHGTIVKDQDLAFDNNKPYDICPSVLDPDICYGQIVYWWSREVHLSQTEIAKLCFGVPTEEGKRYCLVGLSDSISRDIEYQLDEKVSTNFNGALDCKDILNYDDRLSCYHKRLIQPLLPMLTERIKHACAELSIGKYTQMCIETNMEWVSTYERQ